MSRFEPAFARLEDYLLDRYMRNKLKRLPKQVGENLDRAKWYGMLGPKMMADWPLLAAPWLDAVADFGADPTLGADSTSKLQNWLDAEATPSLAVGPASKNLLLPPGAYKITASLNLPDDPGISIFGSGKYSSIIEQQTAGQSILIRSESSAGTAHSLTVKQLGMGYVTDQTNTASVAVFYDTHLGSGSGFFNDLWEDLHVYGPYEAWGYSASGSIATWASTWRNIHCERVKHCAWNLSNATAVGQPCLRFYDIYVNNVGGPTSTGPMFNFQSCDETLIMGLDAEGWYNEIVAADSTYVTMINAHMENNFLSNAFARQFLCSNGSISLNGFESTACTTTAANTDAAVFMWLNANGNTMLQNGVIFITTTLGTSYIRETIYGSVSSNTGAVVQNVVKSGGGLNEYAGNVWTNTLQATQGIAIPIKDSLVIPRRFLFPNGTGMRLQPGSIVRIL